jgi:hypothetical protein
MELFSRIHSILGKRVSKINPFAGLAPLQFSASRASPLEFQALPGPEARATNLLFRRKGNRKSGAIFIGPPLLTFHGSFPGSQGAAWVLQKNISVRCQTREISFFHFNSDGRRNHENAVCSEAGAHPYQPKREKVPPVREENHRGMALPCLH